MPADRVILWIARKLEDSGSTYSFRMHGWYYVGVETESEARGLVGKKRQGETIMGAKHIRNVEHVKAHELRPVPIGNYWGPLIPE
jgi:hypothetical protein